MLRTACVQYSILQEARHDQLSLHVMALQQQVASLERSRSRRTVILKNLPAPLFKKDLDTNLRALCRAAGYDEAHIEDTVNHLDHTAFHTVAFITFATEVVHTAVKAILKRGFWWKRQDGGSDIRVKSEDSISPHDRIAIQPFYALIELVKLHRARELEAGTHVIKANKQQLQIFITNAGNNPEPRLVAQLLFMLTDHS